MASWDHIVYESRSSFFLRFWTVIEWIFAISGAFDLRAIFSLVSWLFLELQPSTLCTWVLITSVYYVLNFVSIVLVNRKCAKVRKGTSPSGQFVAPLHAVLRSGAGFGPALQMCAVGGLDIQVQIETEFPELQFFCGDVKVRADNVMFSLNLESDLKLIDAKHLVSQKYACNPSKSDESITIGGEIDASIYLPSLSSSPGEEIFACSDSNGSENPTTPPTNLEELKSTDPTCSYDTEEENRLSPVHRTTQDSHSMLGLAGASQEGSSPTEIAGNVELKHRLLPSMGWRGGLQEGTERVERRRPKCYGTIPPRKFPSLKNTFILSARIQNAVNEKISVASSTVEVKDPSLPDPEHNLKEDPPRETFDKSFLKIVHSNGGLFTMDTDAHAALVAASCTRGGLSHSRSSDSSHLISTFLGSSSFPSSRSSCSSSDSSLQSAKEIGLRGGGSTGVLESVARKRFLTRKQQDLRISSGTRLKQRNGTALASSDFCTVSDSEKANQIGKERRHHSVTKAQINLLSFNSLQWKDPSKLEAVILTGGDNGISISGRYRGSGGIPCSCVGRSFGANVMKIGKYTFGWLAIRRIPVGTKNLCKRAVSWLTKKKHRVSGVGRQGTPQF